MERMDLDRCSFDTCSIDFFMRPLFTQYGKGSNRDKLVTTFLKPPEQRRISTLWDNPFLLHTVKFFVCFIFVSLGIYGSFKNGRTMAEQKEVFLVMNQSSEVPETVAILRTYSDYLITAPFDPSTKVLGKKLYILKISELGKTPLEIERTVRLKAQRGTP
jgi:hypothetical protein